MLNLLRDKQNIALLMSFIILIISSIAFWIQSARPELSARCELLDDLSPCKVRCVIKNIGRKEARDVSMSFNQTLLLGTRISANPVYNIKLIESDILPNPNLEESKHLRAFIINIPLIPPKTEVSFTLYTNNKKNIEAGKQANIIFEVIRKIMNDFEDRIKKYSRDAKKWNKDLVLSAYAKKRCLYQPGYLLYSGEQIKIKFITEEEYRADYINSIMYKKYKNDFSEIYKNRGQYKAPVYLVKQKQGYVSFASFPPYVRTFWETSHKITPEEIKSRQIEINIIPPEAY